MSPRALVVGGGPAGLSAALQLSTWCAEVDVIEARPRQHSRRAGEHLPPAALAPLCALGLGNLIEDPRHQISSGVSSAWGGEHPADRDYYFSPAGNGVNLRRDIFDEALARQAEHQGITLSYDTRLSDLTQTGAAFDAALRGPDGSHERTFEFVVDASGRHARAARLLGGTLNKRDDLVGIVGHVHGCAPTDDTGRLLIEAVPDGWWYAVQFPDGPMICTFMTDAARLSAHPKGSLGLWQDALSDTTLIAPGAQTGKIPDAVQVYDACSQVLSDPPCANFVAVGDAALAYDPLSSWGITKAIVDGHEGAKCLQQDMLHATGAIAARRKTRPAQYAAYRQQHQAMYRAEQRWPHSHFWRARHRAPVHP